MKQEEITVEAIIANIEGERNEAMQQLRKVIKENLDPTFSEGLSYGMIGYVVPHSIYPAGYHCKPSEALPFISIANQKNFIAVYHMGVYAREDLLLWFQEEFAKLNLGKLDMGKSCIRFKKMDKIPFELLGELCAKMSAQEWISLYEKLYKSNK